VKHIVKAAMLAAGTGLLMLFAFDMNHPQQFFDNTPRTLYLIVTLLIVFAAMSMKKVLSYQTTTTINYTPKHDELKTSALSIGVVLLFFLSPMFDRSGLFEACDCAWIRWVGCLFLFDAIAFFTWSSWVFSKAFYRADGKPVPHKIVSSGPYAVIRHPRFLGLIAWIIGTALVFNNLMSILLAVIIIYIIALKANDEEVFMELEFGEEWNDYKRQTKRFFPLIY
jgi:protein-S-isoprenylcysteine O-methyltransferase Ste14